MHRHTHAAHPDPIKSGRVHPLQFGFLEARELDQTLPRNTASDTVHRSLLPSVACNRCDSAVMHSPLHTYVFVNIIYVNDVGGQTAQVCIAEAGEVAPVGLVARLLSRILPRTPTALGAT